MVRVSVSVDVAPPWVFEEPGWQELGFGHSDEWFYLWSARRVIAFRRDDLSLAPAETETDDDIRLAFPVGSGWLLVCETSVQLFEGSKMVADIEFDEVIVETHWSDQELRIRDMQDRLTVVRIVAGTLEWNG